MAARIAASRVVDAPPELVYSLIVGEGGVGAGTSRARCDARGGATTALRMRVTEPEPGRVLAETVEGTGDRTTFTET